MEVVISLALLSLISVFIMGALSFGKRAWEKESRGEQLVKMEVIQDFLRNRMEGILPLTDPSTVSKKRSIIFAGRNDSLNFIANLPGHTEVAGLYRTSITLHEIEGSANSEKLQIVQTLYRPSNASETADSKENSLVLIEGFRSADFSYFGSTGPNKPHHWHESWTDMMYLPAAIRLEITFDEKDVRQWHPLVIPLKLTQKTLVTN